MPFQDYEEFIAAFNAHGVRYLDILLDPTAANARRALDALRDFFGDVDLGYGVADLTDPRWIIQLGVAPVRIDLAAQIPGCRSFDAAWKRKAEASFGSVKTYYLGLDDLIQAKEAADRAQDRADLRVLRRAKRAKKARA